MEIHEVYSVTATQDDCLLIDIDYTCDEGRRRVLAAYRASDPYSPLTPIITQWLADNPEQEILPYIPPSPPTPEELRALMPALTPRQFRDALADAGILTDAAPDEVTVAISQIQDMKTRVKALNAWEYPTEFTRIDPLIDQIGTMFDLTPDDIDTMWEAASGT